MNVWTRVQLLKTHYQMGSIDKAMFVRQLGQLWKEANATT
jgi:hypothetical protein